MKGKIVRTPISRDPGICQCTLNPRRGGVELVVDCAGCDGTARLDTQKCFSGVVGCIQEQGAPIAITLRSYVERRYDQKPCKLMGQIADVMNKISVLQSLMTSLGQKGQMCSDCVKDVKNKVEWMERSLVSMEFERAMASAGEVKEYRFQGTGRDCNNCMNMTRTQLDDIIQAMRSLEKQVVQGVFKIVGEEDD